MNSDFLGKEKISKLLFKQALPAMTGMFVMSLYNVVDTIYIGRGVGVLALAGVSVSIPIMMSLLAFSMAIGIGSSSLFSRSLGEGKIDKAKNVFGNFLFLIFSLGIVLSVLAYIFLPQILKIFGATEEIFSYAYDYSSVIIMGSFLFIYISSSNNIIRASGHAKLAMLTMIIGAVINIILDPIFIFYLNMGVRGAAYATFLSWFAGSIYVTYYYIKLNPISARISLVDLLPRKNIIKEVFSIGSSSFAGQASVSLMTIITNASLAIYGTSLAIAAFGIISRILMMAMMPVFGIVQGMLPIIGYNWGAKKFSRVKETLILSLKYSTFVTLLFFTIVLVFSGQIIGLFSKDPELIKITKNAIMIILLMFPLVGLQLVSGGFYQALGKAKLAFILSIMRQGILLIPLLIILPRFFDLSGIWYAFPLADLLAFLIALYYISSEFKLLNNKILTEQ